MRNVTGPCLAAAMLQIAPLHAAPFAYVANQGSNTVTVIDVSTVRQVATVVVGNSPYGVAASRDGRFVYVTVQGADAVAVIDGATHSLAAMIPVDGSPMGPDGIAVSPSGDRVYVANDATNRLSVIDTTSRSVIASIPVGVDPYGVVVDPTGTRVYVSNSGADTVSVVDATTNSVIATVPVLARPLGIAVDPTGSRVFVASQLARAVSVIDVARYTLVASVEVGSERLVDDVIGLAVDPSGTRIYVTQPLRNQITVIDATTMAIAVRIPSRSYPLGVSASPDGSRIYVVNSLSNDVSVIDPSTHTVVGRVAVGLVPTAVGQFIGGTAASPAPATALSIEYYNSALDHYFMSHVAAETAKLDAGVSIRGWQRTGQVFTVHTAPSAGTSPVCRFYIPPGLGDSHFYGRGTVECDATGLSHPSFVNEEPQFFHVTLPTFGACPAGAREVYRVFSNRPDANHRYMVDASLRDQMVSKGWLAEGDGPRRVVMCVPI
jgi:YVTN family beta-propeller protein